MRPPAGFVLVGMMLLSACSSRVERPSEKVEPPLVPFGELFVFADTLRLDDALVVGNIMFMDISRNGHLLLSDWIGNAVHLFDMEGSYQKTFRHDACLPERAGQVSSARFGSDGTFVSMGVGGQIVVFDALGRRLAADVQAVRSLAGCTIGDTIHMLPAFLPFAQRKSVAYSMDLVEIASAKLVPPRFPRLNTVSGGFPGRAMDCFEDGPYYTSYGLADAMPVRATGNRVQIRPAFFDERPSDIPQTESRQELHEAIRSHSVNSGVYAIDSRTRMVVYLGLPDKWHTDSQRPSGLGIASNIGHFPARSTLSPFVPLGAANGYIYTLGDSEILPGGDVGNPVVLRYRFVPPSDASP